MLHGSWQTFQGVTSGRVQHFHRKVFDCVTSTVHSERSWHRGRPHLESQHLNQLPRRSACQKALGKATRGNTSKRTTSHIRFLKMYSPRLSRHPAVKPLTACSTAMQDAQSAFTAQDGQLRGAATVFFNTTHEKRFVNANGDTGNASGQKIMP